MATLQSPDGRKYETTDQTEIVRLKAYGYSEAVKAESKPADPKK